MDRAPPYDGPVPAASRRIPIDGPLDLVATLGPVRRGRHDPCLRLTPREAWRATRTPDGPATIHLHHLGGEVVAEAWGPGADWALDAAPALVGAHDVDRDIPVHHPLVADLARRHAGMRVGRTGAVTEALVPTIIEQKVTGMEARRAWHAIVRALGEPAPGPPGLLVPPSPAMLATTPTFRFHRLGLERKRADTVRRVCDRAVRVEEAATMSLADAYRRLQAFPGIGPWSAAEVALVALGDPDAVSVGDYHLPSMVTWAFLGERNGTDERMLELLEPYRGHRARVLRLLGAGHAGPPRRGPRYAPHQVARI